MAKADMTVTIDVDAAPAMRAIKRINRNPRRWLYFVYVPLLLIEWAVDLVGKIVECVRNSVEILTLSVKSYINEFTGKEPTD